MRAWWLTFTDPKARRGEQFLGVVVTFGFTHLEAIRAAWELGVNPGGTVTFCPIGRPVPREYTDRLLGRTEADLLRTTLE